MLVVAGSGDGSGMQKDDSVEGDGDGKNDPG